uniref:Uncharacterized protein n=1 Tax=Meloidogyne enterolobii TaxID=390850 RepID=A0A6V7UJS6_MELEN|nr:unnamed protein product [Meloidogyne enterolobii]
MCTNKNKIVIRLLMFSTFYLMIFLTTTDAVGNRLLFNWLKPQKSKTRGIEIDNNDQVDINKNKETFHISQSKAEISKPIDEHVSGDLIGEIRSVQKYTDAETFKLSSSNSHYDKPSSSKTSSKKYSKRHQKGKKLATIHEGCIYYKQGRTNSNLEKRFEDTIYSLKTLIDHMYEKHSVPKGSEIFLKDILEPKELKQFIEEICYAINYTQNHKHLILLLNKFMLENETMLKEEETTGRSLREDIRDTLGRLKLEIFSQGKVHNFERLEESIKEKIERLTNIVGLFLDDFSKHV